jgi:FkbM family methyltransferase
MNLWTRIWSAYDERVYPQVKGFRGATFLNRFLFDLSFREADGYCLEKDGEKICFARRQPVRRIRDEKLIEGYIKEVEFKGSDVIVDAGPFPGEFSIYSALKGKTVYAVEPDSKNLSRVKENIEKNDLEGEINFIEKGLWSEKTKLSFEKSGSTSQVSEEGEVEVPVTTLDKLRLTLIEDDVDLVKMDIEGAELKALQGSEQIIEDDGPDFSIASYHKVEGTKTCKDVQDFLKEKGYEVHTGHKIHLTTWGRKK